MQILRMLEEGKISAEQAAKLLAALEIGAEKEQGSRPSSGSRAKKARWFRVRVTDGAEGVIKISEGINRGSLLPLDWRNPVVKVSVRRAAN